MSRQKVRARRVFESAVGGAWGDPPGEGDVDAKCIRGTDLLFDKLRVDNDKAPVRGFSHADIRNRSLRPGDIVFEKSGGGENQPVGRVGLVTSDELAVPTNFAGRLRPISDVDPRFTCYYMASLYFDGRTRAAIKQTTGIQNLDIEQLLEAQLLMPPLAEQRAIADYLDAETARIDALIAKKQQLIHLLEERLAAAIDDALDGFTQRVALRWVADRIVDGTHGTYERLDEGPPLLSAKNLKDGIVRVTNEESRISESDYQSITQSRRFETGAVLLGVIGGSIGNLARLRDGDPLAFQRSVAAIMTGPNYLSDFLWFVMKSQRFKDDLDLAANSAAQSGVYLGDLAAIAVPTGPILQQEIAVAELSRMEHEFDELVNRVKRQIPILLERRQALITAAVTGELSLEEVGTRT